MNPHDVRKYLTIGVRPVLRDDPTVLVQQILALDSLAHFRNAAEDCRIPAAELRVFAQVPAGYTGDLTSVALVIPRQHEVDLDHLPVKAFGKTNIHGCRVILAFRHGENRFCHCRFPCHGQFTLLLKLPVPLV